MILEVFEISRQISVGAMEENDGISQKTNISTSKMPPRTDSEKIDLLVDIAMKNSARFEAIEKRLEILEQGVAEKSQVKEVTDALWDQMRSFTERLGTLEHRSLQGVAEEAISKITDENDGLKARMKYVTDVCVKNTESLASSMVDLRLQLNDLRKETVNLTKSTIAQESFERNEEAKNVAVYNITDELIRPFRNHTGSEEEAVEVFVKQLAQQTVENLCDKDIKSIRKISSKSPKGYHSAVITFVSVGDAQKFDFRLNQTMMESIATDDNLRQRNSRRMNTRAGLSVLQRSLLSDADDMIGTYDTRDHPTNRRLRRDNIKKLTDWSRLEKPIEFKPIEIYSITEKIVKEPVTRTK